MKSTKIKAKKYKIKLKKTEKKSSTIRSRKCGLKQSEVKPDLAELTGHGVTGRCAFKRTKISAENQNKIEETVFDSLNPSNLINLKTRTMRVSTFTSSKNPQTHRRYVEQAVETAPVRLLNMCRNLNDELTGREVVSAVCGINEQAEECQFGVSDGHGCRSEQLAV